MEVDHHLELLVFEHLTDVDYLAALSNNHLLWHAVFLTEARLLAAKLVQRLKLRVTLALDEVYVILGLPGLHQLPQAGEGLPLRVAGSILCHQHNDGDVLNEVHPGLGQSRAGLPGIEKR